MPVTKCSRDGKPGYKFGAGGHCYVYTPGNVRSRAQAFGRARMQGAAIKASQAKHGKA